VVTQRVEWTANLHVSALREHFIAVAEFALESPGWVVDSLVCVQVAALGEPTVTHIASVALLSKVSPLVGPQITHLCEATFASRVYSAELESSLVVGHHCQPRDTHVRLLSSVFPVVDVQVRLLSKSLATLWPRAAVPSTGWLPLGGRFSRTAVSRVRI
jgi:hypothetical protein